MTTTNNKFNGYKASFTNSVTGKSYDCFVMNHGHATIGRQRVAARLIRVKVAAGCNDFGKQIMEYNAPKWVRASSVSNALEVAA